MYIYIINIVELARFYSQQCFEERLQTTASGHSRPKLTNRHLADLHFGRECGTQLAIKTKA
jgi:hypothetical protein